MVSQNDGNALRYDQSVEVRGTFKGSDSNMTDAEQRSDELRALLAAIVACSDDAIVSKSLDGIITSWNRGAEKLFGFTAAEAVGQHIFLIIPEERRAEEADVLALFATASESTISRLCGERKMVGSFRYH